METSLANLQTAYAEHCAGRLDEAERLYVQVLSSEPRNAHALHLLGVTFHQKRRHADAIEWISRAIAVDSGNYSFYVNLSAAHMALGQAEPAIAAMRRAIQLEPDRAPLHNDLGVLLANLERWDEAAECFREILRIHSDHAPSYNN